MAYLLPFYLIANVQRATRQGEPHMRLVRLFGAMVLAALLASAGVKTAGAQQQNPTFTLLPGGTATMTFDAFCTNYGAAFPENVQAPNGLAQDNIRGALAYAQQQGLTSDEANLVQVQNAIWQLQGVEAGAADGAVNQDVTNAGQTAPQAPQGTSVLDAAQANQVTVTVESWQSVGDPVQIGQVTDNYFGRGTLRVQNTSNQELTLYMPVGTLFPPSEQGAQTMAGFATNVQVQNPATPTPTATQTPTPAPTTTPAPTPSPTTAPAGGVDDSPNQLPETSGVENRSDYLIIALLTIALIIVGWLMSVQAIRYYARRR
jgi:hypothetical protein